MINHIMVCLRQKSVNNVFATAGEKDVQISDVIGQQKSHTLLTKFLDPISHRDQQEWCSLPLIQTFG